VTAYGATAAGVTVTADEDVAAAMGAIRAGESRG